MDENKRYNLLEQFKRILNIHISNEKNTALIDQVKIYIDKYESDWNKAAVCLAEEGKKLPSKRNITHCNIFIKQEHPESESVTLSTNELNNLALSLVIENDKASKSISNKANPADAEKRRG